MRKSYIFLIAAILLVAALVFLPGKITGNAVRDNLVSGMEVDLYKSASCGCCVGHSGFLRRNGFDVDVKVTENLEIIKAREKIPREMQSCHTAFIGDYFVEGHIPMEAIDKLLEEKPDIDGIALPGMPSGSPGMPGAKDKEWIIYALKDGKYSEFMRI